MLYVKAETNLVGCYEINEATLNDYRKAISSKDKLLLAQEVLQDEINIRGVSLTSPELTKEYVRTLLFKEDREHFYVIYLNQGHSIIKSECLFSGTTNAAPVYPREVVKNALKYNASALIFVHNHPSGSALPSMADKRITKRLSDALELVDIRVLDHFIVGSHSAEITSFAEKGFM
ncbi:RadC family protein [Aliivibrio fischeri]|uniref:JAB domain-containing protein n=1 Tax=Aliivibrio fischeri TaxID=668 RepID=UPI0007C56B8F